MPTYIDIPIETDPQDILDDVYTFLQAQIPGWTPAAGNLDVWLAMSLSAAAAETRDVASAVPTSIFRYFGATIIGLQPIDAAPSTTTTNWTMIDNAGYTIPAGTQVAIAASGSTLVPFVTLNDTVIASGSTTASGVTIQSVNTGAATAGLGAVSGPVQLLDPLSYVSSITQVSVTTGGVDAEADSDYLNRLATYLQLLTPRPILPNDFATLCRTNIPGVFRAVGVDGYDATSNTYNNARTVSVAAIDQNGTPVGSATKASMLSMLQAMREVNFVVYVIDPSVNLIDVTYTAKSLVGYDPTALLASINTAIANYLNPVTWGTTTSDSTVWLQNTVVRYNKMIQAIENVAGVDYLVSMTIGIHGGSMGTTDITLTGVAPLANDNTLTGTIT
jgi:hypothetical protein